MPDISDYYGSGGSTLKPSDIGDDVEATIESFRSKTWDDGTKTLYLKLAGFDKDFRVNATNARRIGEMYGTKIEGWVGKTLTLFVDKVNSPQGGLVDSIIVKVRRSKPAKPKQYDERNPPPSDDIPF